MDDERMSKTPGAYNTAKRVPLECGDVLWFRVAAPQWGEKVWCSKCTDMVTVGMPSHAYTLGFMPDYMWECVREPDRWFTGRCVHDPECGLVIRDRDWTRLKAAMERHHL